MCWNVPGLTKIQMPQGSDRTSLHCDNPPNPTIPCDHGGVSLLACSDGLPLASAYPFPDQAQSLQRVPPLFMRPPHPALEAHGKAESRS